MAALAWEVCIFETLNGPSGWERGLWLLLPVPLFPNSRALWLLPWMKAQEGATVGVAQWAVKRLASVLRLVNLQPADQWLMY